MSKRIRVRLLLFFAILFVVTGVYTTKAETISFNVTVNANTLNKDPMSRKATKADGETNFYVTPTSFSVAGSIKVRSVYNEDTSQYTPWYYVYSNNLNQATINPYNRSIYPGKLYYMQSDYGSGMSSEINVTGRYTP